MLLNKTLKIIVGHFDILQKHNEMTEYKRL